MNKKFVTILLMQYNNSPMQTHHVIAYYLFTRLADPHREVQSHKEFCRGRALTGRVYLSEQGINGQMSGLPADIAAYRAWLEEQFQGVTFKVHEAPCQVFPRMTIKYRKELVALGVEVDLSQKGEYLTPAAFRRELDNWDGTKLLLDVRNQYETAIGHFVQAQLPPLETFRDFPAYARALRAEQDPERPILMGCTGGIRCEIYSSLLKQEGFQQVYQLQGGFIQYGLEEGRAHWQGRLFVFDDRLSVSLDGEETTPIAQCSHCGASNDTYYNCANGECNALFLSCLSCLHRLQGCCQESCMGSPFLRRYAADGNHKPFKRKHLEK